MALARGQRPQWGGGLSVVAWSGVRRQTVFQAGAHAWSLLSKSPRAPEPIPANWDRIALGRALAARVTEATRMTAEAAAAAGLDELASYRFAKPIRDVHKLASRVIARFMITGEGTTQRERNFFGTLGVLAARHGLPVATLARSYFLWRDTNLRILNEEARRLGIALEIFEEARKIIRSRTDADIVGMALAYDDQMARSYMPS
jgi:hypothetical protein